MAFEQKDYLFKLLIGEKYERLKFMKEVATEFFKMGNMRKAEKVYGKVHSYFRTKDAKNNFQKEDDSTAHFHSLTSDLNTLHKSTLTNLCVIHARAKAWKDVIKYADEALTVDNEYVKALYHKGRALLELTQYPEAIEVLGVASKKEPENGEVKREMGRAEAAMKRF